MLYYSIRKFGSLHVNRFKFYKLFRIKVLWKKSWKHLWYPIGTLDNKIEIHFLHYKSVQEAKEKWTNRKMRINYENLLIKFSEQNEYLPALVDRFNKLGFQNKILFPKHTLKFNKLVLIDKTEDLDWRRE